MPLLPTVEDLEAAAAAWHEYTRRTSWEKYCRDHPDGASQLRSRMAKALEAAFWKHLDEPVPYLPVDPEEQRRRDVQASDGEQCMIYRGRS